ncbi:mucoidy inhibitor MuiA family protein [Pontiellaceae bacterium B1224]|nr:mucoidy inhibitor MuiA family protein [Pontiellaceae bacterium B1224]
MVGLIAVAALAVSSQVTDVTVYSDRAQVTRTADVQLKPGMNQLVFDELPEAIDSRGIQVDGLGAAVVLDVRYRVENLEDISKEIWKEFYAKEEALRLEIEAVGQRIEAFRTSKEFLKKISSKVTSPRPEEGEPELDPQSWKRMLDMHLTRRMAYDAEIRKAEKELKALQKKLSKVQADLKNAGARRVRQRRVVEIDVEATEAGKAQLKLSYLVRGPGWTPAYDVRVDTEQRRMGLTYYAMVRQNTGEDWSDVAVKLSTANPGQGGQHPELQPWRIQPVAVRVSKVHRYPQNYNVETGQRTAPVVKPYDVESGQVQIDAKFVEYSEGALEELGFDWSVYGRNKATTSNQGTAVVFEIKSRSEIASDNVEHRVTIGNRLLPAHFRYSTVPKNDATAFLKARTTNASDYPFLAGKANIFLDGGYVASSDLELVPPGEDFWVFLGVDQGMKVEHKLIKRYESSEGFLRKKVRYTYEYLLTVKNTHDKPEEFIIWDRLPISENEEVEVKLLEPDYSSNTEALTLDDSQRLQWFQTLEPGEERKIPFSFYIEMPKGMKVEGVN